MSLQPIRWNAHVTWSNGAEESFNGAERVDYGQGVVEIRHGNGDFMVIPLVAVLALYVERVAE